MRTTVTLEPDVARLLREEMHRRRLSFKECLNRALRAGLTPRRPAAARPFTVTARPMGLRPGLDPARLNQLAEELEVEAVLSRMPPRPRARRQTSR